MPTEGFLQRFHELAEVDEDVRCRAALGVRKALVAGSDGGGDGGSRDSNEDLEYALRRLVRGVQSSRQCCRQGFSLALSEVLAAFPGEVASVLQLIRLQTELLSGLKQSEQKERALGRLFAYAAVLEAGCLRKSLMGPNSLKGKKLPRSPVTELGGGLQEIYAMRPYLRGVAARILSDLCCELSTVGLAARVPEALDAWNLDAKIGITNFDMHAAAVVLQLRVSYEDAQAAGATADSLKPWPSCVREDSLAQPSVLAVLLNKIGDELASAPVGDAVPWVLDPFCSWWLRPSTTRNPVKLQEHVWPALEQALFPEHASPVSEAQGLRALAEIVVRLHAAGAAGGATGAETLLIGLFEKMPRGIAQMLRSLSWSRAQTHGAALFAQHRLIKAISVSESVASCKQQRRKMNRKDKCLGAHETRVDGSSLLPSWPLVDDSRLAILAALQSHTAFGTVKGAFQRQWQQALLTPLSPRGVRARCATLLSNLQGRAQVTEISVGDGSSAGHGPCSVRVCADQLVQLATHGHAPDEVILAALCLLLTASYFVPCGDAHASVGYSLRAFRSAVGLSTSVDGVDLLIPVLASTTGTRVSAASVTSDGADGDAVKVDSADGDAENRSPWRRKLWSALVELSRRMSPEQAVNVMSRNSNSSVVEGMGCDVDAAGMDGAVRTFAFNGCLSDGSLWVLRLHEWWDYIMEQAPMVADAEALTSPRASQKKKKKRRQESSAGLNCVAPLDQEDWTLRRRCIDVCRKVLGERDVEGALSVRQRNALCMLPLCLALLLLDASTEDERMTTREQLQEVISVFDEFLVSGFASEAPKPQVNAQQRWAKALVAVPRIAAELFVESTGLVKEAARAAWRELGEFASDETMTSLCAAVREADEHDPVSAELEADRGEGAGKDEQTAGADGSSEDGEGDDGISNNSAAVSAKVESFQMAIKEARDDKGSADGAKANGDEDDDVDEVVLDSESVWQQLLDDGDGTDEGSLLAAFASSGLQGASTGPRLSKRQQRLRQRQEELTRKFREIDLLEIFLQRFVDKRPICVHVLQEMHKALLSAGRRVTSVAGRGSSGDADEEAGASKKKTKVDAMFKRLEGDVMRRISQVLRKMMRQVCRNTSISAVCQWQPANVWAEHAHALFASGQGSQAAAGGQLPADLGAVLLYWICALHNARITGEATTPPDDWTLAGELLLQALQVWSTRRDSERWCVAIFNAFAVRMPKVLLRLPWCEQIQSSRNSFVQRAQVSFVANQLLRGLPSETEGAAAFSTKFVTVCADLLEESFCGKTGSDAMTASQRHKVRRDMLAGISIVFRGRAKRRSQEVGQVAIPAGNAATKRISVLVAKVRDSLPARRGEVYRLCLQVLRVLPAGCGSETPAVQRKLKRVHRSSSGDESSVAVKGQKECRERAKSDSGEAAGLHTRRKHLHHSASADDSSAPTKVKARSSERPNKRRNAATSAGASVSDAGPGNAPDATRRAGVMASEGSASFFDEM